MKRRKSLVAGAAIGMALLALGACHEAGPVPGPQEPTENSVAEFCGMSLQEHSGPKAQVFVDGRDAPYWFSSVHDMFAFTMVSVQRLPIRAIYVNDMGKARNWDHPEPGTWIEARGAYFVIGSGRRGGMNEEEAIPFGTEAAARGFVAEHGGRVVRFDAVPADYVLPGYTPDSSQSRSSSHD
jgi:copper chaperone NosL